MTRKFGTIWVMEPGKDFSDALGQAERIEFICNGFERDPSDRLRNIAAAVEQFNPATDAWIPVGRMTSVAQTGLALGKAFPGQAIQVGVYREGQYTWQEM